MSGEENASHLDRNAHATSENNDNDDDYVVGRGLRGPLALNRDYGKQNGLGNITL